MTTSTGQAVEEQRDINDLFDDIVLTEERLTKAGYDEGFAEGRGQGNKEGYQLGYAQGVQLGEELGGIYGTVVAHQQQQHTERLRRTLQQLRECIEAFPRENNPEEDIIGAVENIRTLHKRMQAMLGSKHTPAKQDVDIGTAVRKDLSF